MPRLYSMKALCAALDLSETTIRKLIRLGHLPPPKKVAGSIPKWTRGQVRGYLYALENDLLPPVPDEDAQGRQEKKGPRKGTRKAVKPQSEPDPEAGAKPSV